MIKTVTGDGIRSAEAFHIELERLNLVAGDNGTGKSSIVVAMWLARHGYLPGHDKTLLFQNASGRNMSAGITCEAGPLQRMWDADRKGKVSATATVGLDAMAAGPAQRQAVEDAIDTHFGAALDMVDGAGFFDKPPIDQRRTILGMVGDPDKYETAQADMTKHNASLQDARKRRKGAEGVVSTLRMQVAEIDRPVGNLHALELEEKQLTGETVGLRAEIKRAEQAAFVEERRAGATEKLSALAKQQAELREKAEDTVAEIAKWEADRVEHAANPVPRPGYDCELSEEGHAAVRDAIAQLERLTIPDTELQHALDIVAILNPLLISRDACPEAFEAFDQWEKMRSGLTTAVDSLGRKVEALQGQSADLDTRITDGKVFIINLGEPQPAGDPNDPTLLQGMDARLGEIAGTVRALNRIDAVEAQIETAKVEVVTAGEEEDKAADDLADAKEVVSAMVNDAVQTLATRSSEILPEGALGLEDDGRKLHITWIRSERKPVSRHTLSGGEQKVFDGALGYAICPEAPVIIEAAEIDNKILPKLMEKWAASDIAQMIVLTCHGDEVITSDTTWNVIQVG